MTDQELQKKRLIAAAIDVAIGIAIWMVFGVASVLLGLVVGQASDTAGMFTGRILGFLGAGAGLGYVLFRDVLARGRSFGKQTQNIRVLTTGGQALTPVDSAKRNAIFALGSALGFISATLQLVPCLGDAVACVLMPLFVIGMFVTLVAVVVELVKITQDPQGVRLGDQWAGTRVTN